MAGTRRKFEDTPATSRVVVVARIALELALIDQSLMPVPDCCARHLFEVLVVD